MNLAPVIQTASKIRCHGIISSSACDPLSFEQRLMKLMPAPDMVWSNLGAGDGTGLYDDAAPRSPSKAVLWLATTFIWFQGFHFFPSCCLCPGGYPTSLQLSLFYLGIYNVQIPFPFFLGYWLNYLFFVIVWVKCWSLIIHELHRHTFWVCC